MPKYAFMADPCSVEETHYRLNRGTPWIWEVNCKFQRTVMWRL